MIWVLWPLTAKMDTHEIMEELGILCNDVRTESWDEDTDVCARNWLQMVRINNLPEEDQYVLPKERLHAINNDERV